MLVCGMVILRFHVSHVHVYVCTADAVVPSECIWELCVSTRWLSTFLQYIQHVAGIPASIRACIHADVQAYVPGMASIHTGARGPDHSARAQPLLPGCPAQCG